MQLGKLYDEVGLRFTEKDKNDWILALDLLIEAVLTRVAVAVTATYCNTASSLRSAGWGLAERSAVPR
jgi:hypothetical protein